MSLSIITPHFNDYKGIKHIHKCLLKQTLEDWEWIIVDDLSDSYICDKLNKWYENLEDRRVKLFFGKEKKNASACRNLGADLASHSNLVFLDADDFLDSDFVKNRKINFKDFAIFPNYYIINEKGEKIPKKLKAVNLLNEFLAANFLWQTSCVLWNKEFFCKIKKFNPKLPRLQDVELAIRALQVSSNYKVIKNNKLDFFYKVIPIRSRKAFVKPVCTAVYLFISEILDLNKLTKTQVMLLRGYYYLCTKYFERSNQFVDGNLVLKNLKLFYKTKIINLLEYIIGRIVFKLYILRLISGFNFLRINRYFFKPR